MSTPTQPHPQSQQPSFLPSEPAPALSARAVAVWDAIAHVWDRDITAHGNKYWTSLQEPSLARLMGPHLATEPGPRALNLATGNGLCARWLARRGAREVVATDGAEGMLNVARGYADRVRVAAEEAAAGGDVVDGAGGGGVGEGKGVGLLRFRKVDVTSAEDLAGLVAEEGRFDVVLMNMAMMDVADLEPLAAALRKLLAPGGVFVATLLHPMFFTSWPSRIIDLRDDPATGKIEVVRGKLIREYMSMPLALGIAVVDQPVKQAGGVEPTPWRKASGADTHQIYFHRPMHELFTIFFRQCLVMDGMEELAFTEEDAEPDKLHSI